MSNVSSKHPFLRNNLYKFLLQNFKMKMIPHSPYGPFTDHQSRVSLHEPGICTETQTSSLEIWLISTLRQRSPCVVKQKPSLDSGPLILAVMLVSFFGICLHRKFWFVYDLLAPTIFITHTGKSLTTLYLLSTCLKWERVRVSPSLGDFSLPELSVSV